MENTWKNQIGESSGSFMNMLLAESYFHTFNPVLFPIWGDFAVRWYGMAYVMGFMLAWAFMHWMARTGRSSLDTKTVTDIMFAIILGVLLGGRLGHVILYQHGRPFIEFTDSFPFWEVLAINRGGMSAHGGMIGVIIACGLLRWKSKLSALHLLDMIVLPAALSLGFGRIANFMNGELHGRSIDQSLHADPPWWSMKFPQEMHDWSIDRLHSLSDVVNLVGIETEQWLKYLSEFRGIESGVNKLIAATQNDNQQVIDALRPLLTPFYPSQIYQAITDGVILMILLIVVWLKPRKPGVVGSWFLIGYGVLRIITERYRQPDEGVALLFDFITRGQLLSIVMVIAGIVGLIMVTRRDQEKLGGLLKPISPGV